MPSKWCSNCQEIVSMTGGYPSFCCWCGKNLTKEDGLPEFKTYDKRVALENQLKHCKGFLETKQSTQLKLFA